MGPTVTRPVQDPLAVLRLESRLNMSPDSRMKVHKGGETETNETSYAVLNVPATSAASFGITVRIMSMRAASLYSFHASAFFAICSASALALASIAKASASPETKQDLL